VEWVGWHQVPNLLEATEVLLTEAREKIKELAQQYYTETNKEGSDDHRPITRPERIPPSAEDMQAKHEITFADMQVHPLYICRRHIIC
jgi:hypothetical protein